MQIIARNAHADVGMAPKAVKPQAGGWHAL